MGVNLYIYIYTYLWFHGLAVGPSPLYQKNSSETVFRAPSQQLHFYPRGKVACHSDPGRARVLGKEKTGHLACNIFFFLRSN